jgi:predicted nucleotidyltransferase
MRRADVIAEISAHREELVRRFAVRSLSLFGSVARDEARPGSDIDVLVEFEGPTTFEPLRDSSRGFARSSIRISCVSRDPLLYVADIVAAGEAILRFTMA